jgi:hypothetical protein
MGVLARLEHAGSCVFETSEEAIAAARRLVQDG